MPYGDIWSHFDRKGKHYGKQINTTTTASIHCLYPNSLDASRISLSSIR